MIIRQIWYPALFVNGVIQDFENPRGEETIIPVNFLMKDLKLGSDYNSATKMKWTAKDL